MQDRPSDIRSAAALMALLSIRGIGPKTALRIAYFDEDLDLALGERLSDFLPGLTEARHELERCHEDGIRAVSIFDPDYPQRLRAIPDPPPVLFIGGSLEALDRDRVIGVVGTREPTDFGASATEEIVAALAPGQWVVVSGLAKGIDTIAHRAALGHHTPTTAVMAGGLDRIYPAENRGLAREILDQGGALVSEHRVGVAPNRAAFVRRNRIQSGLSAALVVTQTGISGGTMHTVRHAAAQGRPLFCAEPHTDNPRSEGLRVLLGTPARGLCEVLPAWKDARELCAKLGEEPLARPLTRENLADLAGVLDQVLDADTQRNPEPRWWPEGRSMLEARDQVRPHDRDAPLFAVSDKR
ncbi:MAG TPA: DNA-processing protein DprA [Solirubrobacterales bacterium]|jgi:DNA processing protein|nr:DNA-processing protein DprA [Solirubrobacterales bacterium]